MSSHEGETGSGTVQKLAGAAAGVAALSGVASADDGGTYLFDPAAADVEDAVGFVAADAVALNDHDDLLEFEVADLEAAWRSDGTTSTATVADDVDARVDLPVADAQTVLAEADVDAADVESVAGVGATAVGADDRLGGVAVEGSFDAAGAVDALSEVTDLEAIDGDGDLDRYRVVDDRLEGDVVVAAGDGRLLVGGTGAVDADGGDQVDRLLAAADGDAARLGPESDHVGDVLEELSDVPAVAGVEWAFPGESAALVPDYVEGPLRAHGVLPDGVSPADLAADVGALAVGADPEGPRTVGVVAYDGDPPVAAARDVLDAVRSETDRLSEVDLSVSASGSLLVVEASTTADDLTSAQEDLRQRLRETGTLRAGVRMGALPSLKGAYRAVESYWNAFVDRRL
jgi:hypothetical protein